MARRRVARPQRRVSASHRSSPLAPVQRGSFLSHRPDEPGQRALRSPGLGNIAVSLSLFLSPPPSRNFDDEFPRPATSHSSACSSACRSRELETGPRGNRDYDFDLQPTATPRRAAPLEIFATFVESLALASVRLRFNMRRCWLRLGFEAAAAIRMQLHFPLISMDHRKPSQRRSKSNHSVHGAINL